MAVRSELFSNSGAIPFQYLVTIIAPDFYGNPVTRNDWFGYYAEWASFIGIIPFTFAITSLFIKNNKTRFFFFFAGLVSLVLTLDTPLQQLLAALRLPIFSTSIPSRMIILFSFSFAVLAGFGFDVLMHTNEKGKLKKVSIPLALVGVLLLVVWIFLFGLHVLPKEKLMLAVRNFMLPTLLFIVTAAIIIVSIKLKKKIVPVILGVLLLGLTAGDSLRFAQKWMPFDPREFVFPDVPVIGAMKKNISDGRAYGDFGAFIDTYYDIPSVDGYDPLYNKRYGEFIQSAAAGKFINAQRSVVSLDKRGKYTERVLDLLAVNTIYHPISNTNQGWAFPVWGNPKKYAVIYQDDKFQLFRNNTALPHAKLFYDYEVIKDNKAIIERFYADKFDFRNKLILEEDPKGISNAKGKKSNSKVTITSYTPNKITISVFSDKSGLLFLSDSYYPKWKVKVNGKDEKVYIADYAFRAVVVPEGKSEVEFYYTGLF